MKIFWNLINFVFSYLIKKGYPASSITTLQISNQMEFARFPCRTQNRARSFKARDSWCVQVKHEIEQFFFSFLADCYIEIDSCTRLPPPTQHRVQPLPRELCAATQRWTHPASRVLPEETISSPLTSSFPRGHFRTARLWLAGIS